MTNQSREKESTLASYAAVLVWLVRAASVIAVFVLVAVAARHPPVKGWLDSYPILGLAFLPCIGVSLFLSEKYLPSETIVWFFLRRDIEPQLNDRHARLGCWVACVLMVLLFVGTDRREHEAPDEAEVYVQGGRMVPLPYAGDFGAGGQRMTLSEARLQRAEPVTEGIDWTYTTRGYRWLLMTPESGWSVEWAEEEPGDYDGP